MHGLTRLLIACLLGLSLTAAAAALDDGSPAVVTRAYDDVPLDHWAYAALDSMAEQGVLEGYPEGFFKGQRSLTRYEFAQAIARLLDDCEITEVSAEAAQAVQRLTAEFSDELTAMQLRINALEGTTAEWHLRLHGAEVEAAAQDKRLSNLGAGISRLSQRDDDWSGSLRYRWQAERSSSPVRDERLSQQLEFRLGYTRQLSDELRLSLRLSSYLGDGFNRERFNYDPWFGLGASARPFASPRLSLDQAYLRYSPQR